MAGVRGTGLVADDLFLMAHDDVTGRAFLQPRAVGLGLAGGLLAELMLPGALTLAGGWLVPGEAAPPREELGCWVLGLVRAEPDRRPVRDWLAFLARSAAADVAARLEVAGYLTQAAARWPWRGERRVPADPDCAFAPLARARPALDAGASSYSVVLAGLAVACGLGSRLLPYGPPEARRNLSIATRRLPPGVPDLIAEVQAAVDCAVLAHRLLAPCPATTHMPGGTHAQYTAARFAA